ncbi:hypothetical protein L7F22_013055 [Adiantum nelumboides]|nr:hypothetical protein [Adiantum nelumboides]
MQAPKLLAAGVATVREHRRGVAALILLFCACLLQLVCNNGVHAATSVGFYATTCPNAELIIKQAVQARFASDPTITAGLLRMFFHDCFVNGCDASLLIESTPGNTAEKEAGPNLTVGDFDLIDTIKTQLEAACPGIVSCADIVAVATRDSVALAGGPSYAVKTGRFDGKRSVSSDANILPSPASTVDQARGAFASQGLSLNDMVTLLGAHTTGFAHCGFFSDRLFDFRGTGSPDPTMNPALVTRLRGVCPDPASGSASDPSVALDQGTRDSFDTSYYTQLRNGNGILQIDQELTGDARTAPLVAQFTSATAFFPAFVRSITVMGDLNLKTAANGEIRRNCRRVNPLTPPTPHPQPPNPPPKPPTPPPPKPPTPPPPKPPTPSPPKPPTPPPKPSNPPPPKPPIPPPPKTTTPPPPKPPSPPPKQPTPPPPPKPPSPPPPKPPTPPPKPPRSPPPKPPKSPTPKPPKSPPPPKPPKPPKSPPKPPRPPKDPKTSQEPTPSLSSSSKA